MTDFDINIQDVLSAVKAINKLPRQLTVLAVKPYDGDWDTPDGFINGVSARVKGEWLTLSDVAAPDVPKYSIPINDFSTYDVDEGGVLIIHNGGDLVYIMPLE